MERIQGPLQMGSRGPYVRLLQERLGLPADGAFGIVTDTAVRRFQARARLVPDGIVGRQTAAALGFAYEASRAVTPQRQGGATPGDAVVRFLEAVAQAVAAFARDVAGTLRQLGAMGMQVVSFVESMAAQAAAMIRGQAAEIARFASQVAEAVTPRITALLSAVFRFLEQRIRQLAELLRRVPGLDRLAMLVEAMVHRVQAAGRRAVELAAGLLRGAEGTVDRVAAQIRALLAEAAQGLAGAL